MNVINVPNISKQLCGTRPVGVLCASLAENRVSRIPEVTFFRIILILSDAGLVVVVTRGRLNITVAYKAFVV